MSHDILKKYMMSFSMESLKGFLGEDLIESLLEWHEGTEPFLTKAKCIDMILCIYGTAILKNKNFRTQLLKVLPKDKLYEISTYLPDGHSDNADLLNIVETVSGYNWKENPINNFILRLLAYRPEEVFEKKGRIVQAVEQVSSYERFYELLDYQYIIRQRALNILTSKYSLRRFLIHMPTGTGKTKTAIHIICHHYNYNLHREGLVLWIAHTTELLQQAYDTFVSVWKNIGNGTINVYKMWGECNIEIPDESFSGFMVCGLQKLQAVKKNASNLFERLLLDTRLIVFDEAHKACASETKNLIEKFMCRSGNMPDRALMGLSATPGRTTGLSFDNELLVSMFGNKIISIDTKLMNAVNMSAQEAANSDVERDIIKYFQKRGVLARIIKEELSYPEDLNEKEIDEIRIVVTENGYEDFSKSALEIIGKNKSRNLKILQRLRELNKQNKPTIVFACSVKHGQLLSAMLTLEGIPNAVIVGDMPAAERSIAITRFKDRKDKLNILINYEVLTTGFDATNIECVFITRPTQSVVLYSQMLGRGLRGPEMGGNSECLLIDMKDNLQQYNENMAFSHFDNYWNL